MEFSEFGSDRSSVPRPAAPEATEEDVDSFADRFRREDNPFWVSEPESAYSASDREPEFYAAGDRVTARPGWGVSEPVDDSAATTAKDVVRDAAATGFEVVTGTVGVHTVVRGVKWLTRLSDGPGGPVTRGVRVLAGAFAVTDAIDALCCPDADPATATADGTPEGSADMAALERLHALEQAIDAGEDILAFREPPSSAIDPDKIVTVERFRLEQCQRCPDGANRCEHQETRAPTLFSDWGVWADARQQLRPLLPEATVQRLDLAHDLASAGGPEPDPHVEWTRCKVLQVLAAEAEVTDSAVLAAAVLADPLRKATITLDQVRTEVGGDVADVLSGLPPWLHGSDEDEHTSSASNEHGTGPEDQLQARQGPGADESNQDAGSSAVTRRRGQPGEAAAVR